MKYYLSIIQNYWEQLPDRQKAIGLVFCLLFLLFLGAYLKQSNNNNPTTQLQQLDTFIPENHVLIPIEIENFESVDSILGQYGVVDLYIHPANPRHKAKKVVSGIKMIRSPIKPQQFAVLAHKNQAPQVVEVAGPYFVVIQNPKHIGTEFEKQLPKPRQRSIWVEM